MGTFDDLRATLHPVDNQRKGKQFESVCQWFLENDPTYQSLLRRVWLWDDWPGRRGIDAGIDLVAEDNYGKLWAIQAKVYAPSRSISKRDVDKFVAESSRSKFTHRLLIATTDKRHHIATRLMDDLRIPFIGLTQLRAADDYLEWPSTPAALRPSKPPKPKKPWDYQRTAINDVVKGFNANDRGQLIMACGTGKTLTAWFITERLKAERALVLVPSLSLLKQTMREWQTANPRKPFATLPVCSDETVGALGEDAAVAHTSDLGVPVTTDPEVIAEFLRKRSGPRVVFSTYQSSPRIAAAFTLGRVPQFDLVIADEAHRVAGPVSGDFGTVLDATAIRGKRRLFMTATPRYFTGRVLREAKEADYEIASMDDPGRFGNVLHRLSFSEAIDRKLLTDYQVAVIGVDDATYRAWAERGALVTLDGKKITDARALAGQIGLAKAMKKFDLRRTISFHSRVKTAREFAASMPTVLAWMPPRQRPKGWLWSDYASGEMPAGERGVLIQRLKRLDDGERGLLANARCLAEGVDVPALDGVAFIDPRRSEVDIVQAVGRAIRKSDNKKIGTVVIPVFIDSEEDPEVALDSSVFKPVWDVIKALRAHDTELGEELDALRREMGRKGGKPRLPDKIYVDLPATVGKSFADAFEVRLVDATTAPWEFWYGLLEKRVAQIGNAPVFKDEVFEGHRLGGWCVTQRVKGRNGTLSEDRFALLDSFPGWMWDRHEGRWEAGYRLMLEYQKEHGDTLIPATVDYKGYPLGTWASIQRSDGRAGKLNVDRYQKLDAIPGWVWHLEDERWENGFRHLQEYVDEYGNSRVKQSFKSADGFALGAWVNFQRLRYRQGRLVEPHRAERLAVLPGWVWSALDAKWEDGFQALKWFAETYGHVNVPIGFKVDGLEFDLRNWYANQKPKFHKLSIERQERLSSLPGWASSTQEGRWEGGFRRMLDYVREFGDAKVERGYQVDGFPLGAWAMTQRGEFKKGSLSKDRIKRLSALPGWDWDRRGGKWEEGFARLRIYIKNHGSPPSDDYEEEDLYRLGAWTAQQRHLKRSGKLSPDRMKRLDRLKGWDWSPPRGASARRWRTE
ncbi:UvrABC system protein B [Mycolicibacterium vanbaalenii]|uniref:UvrABC system protein B n=1 Tax=Mycolicibacterium vanbaalenii TaxID=110539 RepID=A0A5S9NZB3_MYCVN|nr:DEAD/DEAH box helicase [Mycolicibacterium vanbaalenii]CAA0096105.1 UvrABC system protein B [Mycolicibacterium vanbaalenii]